MPTVIEALGLHRRYGGQLRSPGFHAVRGIDLAVEEGSLFALLGTNGAGKTSTLEVLEGLARPSEGRVRVLGHDPYQARRKIRPSQGIMLQDGGFPSDLTAIETVRMWAGTMRNPRPAAEVLDLVDLSRRARVSVKALSGGERRRLDLACAVLNRPRILFLDEPTTGLDPESRANAWQLVDRLRTDRVTIMLTTHYLDEAENLADELAIMHQGLIRRVGTVADVVSGHPSTITFDDLDEAAGRAFPPQLVGSLHRAGGRTQIRTFELQQTLTRLLGWASSERVQLNGLTARQASLETVFLSLTEDDRPGPAVSQGSPSRDSATMEQTAAPTPTGANRPPEGSVA